MIGVLFAVVVEILVAGCPCARIVLAPTALPKVAEVTLLWRGISHRIHVPNVLILRYRRLFLLIRVRIHTEGLLGRVTCLARAATVEALWAVDRAILEVAALLIIGGTLLSFGR